MRTWIMATAVMVLASGSYAAYRADENLRNWVDYRIGLQTEKPEAKVRKRAPAPVRVAKTTRRDVPVVLEGVGNVQALSTVEIKARIDGQLMQAAVKDGQFVKAGDLLFRLDGRPLIAQLHLAEAHLSRDEANLAKLKADVLRFQQLASKGISPQTRLEEAQSSLAALEAAIRASQAAVEIARLNLDYATVRAPISGRVGSVLMTPGNMVKANDTRPMLVITQTKPVNVAFALPEQYLDELRRRMEEQQKLKVDVTVPGGKKVEEHGQLFFLNNVVDTASGTILVMARFDNEDDRLVPGQFARARLTLEVLMQSVVAPSRAIQINQKGHYAWVMKDDRTVEVRPVKVGPIIGDEVVITSGLEAGETIVTDGQLRLFPGAKVKPDGDNPAKGKAKKVQS